MGEPIVKERPVSYSYTEQVQMVTSPDLNGYGRLFGGRLMEWIDVVAGIVARRHSGCKVTTAMVDTLCFRAPAYPNDTVVLAGKVTRVGTTSMEVCVRTMVEDLNGIKRTINKAYLVLVALDDDEKPTKVPGLILETDEDRMEWELGEKRGKLREERRKINAG
ncbi:MAG TPA: acyl-CoA thioesterase [Candidatus Monoglobus merdigallinarum]|uniref:Acyl-CoA thioesterase n=1 Tax=Candidatus Monoglobus merdigallinarum TaxID=2838698 RepID=A0A9D1PQS6_9FIRM|nr:acyl-CoA thioesterase [Candidatus Monoglobus merdigallinarum]